MGYKQTLKDDNGMPTFPTKNEVFRRLAICEQCPMLENDGKCQFCGCYVENRASFSHQHCPMNEW